MAGIDDNAHGMHAHQQRIWRERYRALSPRRLYLIESALMVIGVALVVVAVGVAMELSEYRMVLLLGVFGIVLRTAFDLARWLWRRG